ncbi:MAG: hypothetical protein ACRD0S_07850, partial [Acidimicrobiales bacterium]
LGLVRTELGQVEEAVSAFDAAAELFDTSTADGRRGRVATLHNRGMAHAALGTDDGLDSALADYEEAQGDLDADEAPYHHGLVHHSIGSALMALAGHRPAEQARLYEEATHAFGESLTVFTRPSFPYQHALAKYNLGLALASLADVAAHADGGGGKARVQNLRRALARFEDATAILDTRLHADAWKQAYASLARVEEQLSAEFPGSTRVDHFAALLATTTDEERAALLRERMFRLFALPDTSRDRALTEMALAAVKVGRNGGLIMECELELIMEMRHEHQEPALRARFAAHRQLGDEEEREAADQALDAAIGAALGAPQRVFVRDFLYSLGWERP